MNRAAPSLVRPRIWLIAITGVLAAIVMLTSFRPVPKPQSLPSIDRKNLVLRNGRLFVGGQTRPFTGLLVEHYPDGSLQSRSQVSNGLLQGVSEGWYTNRVLQVREHFKQGISDGPRTKWHPNGHKLSEGVIVAGVFQGLFQRWHENGALAERVTMRDGKPDGLAESFYQNGSPKARVTLRQGALVSEQHWQVDERKFAEHQAMAK